MLLQNKNWVTFTRVKSKIKTERNKIPIAEKSTFMSEYTLMLGPRNGISSGNKRETLYLSMRGRPHHTKLHFTEDLMCESNSMAYKTYRKKYTDDYLKTKFYKVEFIVTKIVP